MQLVPRCFLLCQTAWQAAKGFKSHWAVQPAAPSRAGQQAGELSSPFPQLPTFQGRGQSDVLEVSMQEGNFSVQRKTGSEAFRNLGSNCLLCQSTMLWITRLHLFQRKRTLLQGIPDSPSRSWINGLKQLGVVKWTRGAAEQTPLISE